MSRACFPFAPERTSPIQALSEWAPRQNLCSQPTPLFRLPTQVAPLRHVAELGGR